MDAKRSAMILFSLFIGLWASTALGQAYEGRLGYCYGAYCGEAPSGYNGPAGEYRESWSGSTGSSGASRANDAAYQAYRNGKIQEYREFRAEMEAKRYEVERQRLEAEANVIALQKLRQQIKAEIDITFPKLDTNVMGAEARRALNPIPAGSSEEQMQTSLDALWKSVREKSPVETARELSKLSEMPMSAAAKEFYRRELVYSGLANGQGLVRLPFAQTPDSPFQNRANTPEGAEIRNGVNEILASQSAVGAKCASGEIPADTCALAQSGMADAIGLYYTLDRMLAMDAGVANPFTQYLREELLAYAKFQAGVAQGIWDGAVGVVEGVYQMLAYPIDTVNGMVAAFQKFPEVVTAIDKLIDQSIKDFENGDAGVRGRIIGRMGFEIGSLFVPAGAVAKIAGFGAVSKLAAFETIAQVVGKSARAASAGMTPALVRATLIAEHLKVPADKVGEFISWSQKYLTNGDPNLAVRFAREGSYEKYQLLRSVENQVGNLSDGAKGYLASQVGYETRILQPGEKFNVDRLSKIGRAFDEVDGRMRSVPLSKAPAEGLTVTRGMRSEYKDKFDRIRSNSPGDLMKINEGGTYSSHRFSAPGEGALYTTLEPHARATIVKELGIESASDAIFQTEIVSPQRILDFRNPAVIQHIGVKGSQITDLAYDINQVIGSVARRHGIDAIIAPAAGMHGAFNLILFKGL